MNARSITPSIPRNLPTGSSAREAYARSETPSMLTLAKSHIISPAGSAVITARQSTFSTFCFIVFFKRLGIFGFLNEGSSRTNMLCSPFNTVLLRQSEQSSVITIDAHKNAVKSSAQAKLLFAKNIVMIAISSGNLPLQGVSEFVSIATRRSLGESIIRQPVTPTALQPYPIQVVSACLPHPPQQAKALSVLKARRGRSPSSSIYENIGKNTAIGGSITATTQKSTRRTPYTARLTKPSLTPTEISSPASLSSRNENSCCKSCDG